MSTVAEAPSLSPLALAAVTVPSFLNAGLSFAAIAMVESGRGCSSVSKIFGSPFRCGMLTGTISCLNFPAEMAAAGYRRSATFDFLLVQSFRIYQPAELPVSQRPGLASGG